MKHKSQAAARANGQKRAAAYEANYATGIRTFANIVMDEAGKDFKFEVATKSESYSRVRHADAVAWDGDVVTIIEFKAGRRSEKVTKIARSQIYTYAKGIARVKKFSKVIMMVVYSQSEEVVTSEAYYDFVVDTYAKRSPINKMKDDADKAGIEGRYAEANAMANEAVRRDNEMRGNPVVADRVRYGK